MNQSLIHPFIPRPTDWWCELYVLWSSDKRHCSLLMHIYVMFSRQTVRTSLNVTVYKPKARARKWFDGFMQIKPEVCHFINIVAECWCMPIIWLYKTIIWMRYGPSHIECVVILHRRLVWFDLNIMHLTSFSLIGLLALAFSTSSWNTERSSACWCGCQPLVFSIHCLCFFI